MKFALTLLALVALGIAPSVMGTLYSRCSLAKAMYALGAPKEDLDKWACIAYHESSFNTATKQPSNSGSTNYGIFQINDQYWCQPESGEFSNNKCKVNCNKLLGSNLGPAINCALKIKKKEGFSAWSTWKNCKGKLPSIDDCF